MSSVLLVRPECLDETSSQLVSSAPRMNGQIYSVAVATSYARKTTQVPVDQCPVLKQAPSLFQNGDGTTGYVLLIEYDPENTGKASTFSCIQYRSDDLRQETNVRR